MASSSLTLRAVTRLERMWIAKLHLLPSPQICVKKRKAASFGGLLPGVQTRSHVAVPHLNLHPHPPSMAVAEPRTDRPEPFVPPIPRVDPHKIVENDLHDIVKDIRTVIRTKELKISCASPPHVTVRHGPDFEYRRYELKELGGNHPELCNVASYYFDGQGKAVRPLMSILMARAINAHLHGNNSFILPAQKQLALVSEMIHTATLVHDDVIDTSDTRRGKPSVNALFGQKKAIIGGDYILAKAGAMVAKLNNDEVTQILAQVLEDLVQGEFMQMGANEESQDRFMHYIGKTFNKTASLIAYTCKGVAILGGSDESLAELAFQYGKNVGIAFQLIDDLLDFVSSTATMGKPAAADLQLGLATAPVLFAAQKNPQLDELVDRRFSKEGDVQKALDIVHNSDGLEQTKALAQNYCAEAIRYASTLQESPYQKGLISITDKVLNRSK